MPGLERLFWLGIRLQRRRGEENTLLGPKMVFAGAGIPRQSYRSYIPPCHLVNTVRGYQQTIFE
jgi:hypothetical protein